MPILSRAAPGTVVTAGSLITPGGQSGPAGLPGEGFNWKGAWNNSTAYVPGDVVEKDGSTYICVGNSTGNDPATDDGTHWEVMASQGQDGTPGIPGLPGDDGLPAYTDTTAAFTVPAVGATASVTVEETGWIAIGQFVWLAGAGSGGDAGALKVTAISGNTVTLLNPESFQSSPSGDPNNLLSIGSDGLLYLPAIDLISADEGNIAVEGSDHKVYVPGVVELEIDLDLYVPLSHPDAPNPQVCYPTIQAAVDHLSLYAIPPDRTATIRIYSGFFAPFTIDHPNGNRIRIFGVNSPSVPFTGVGPVAGSAYNWTLNFSGGGDTSNFEAGKLGLIPNCPGIAGRAHVIVPGCSPVLGVGAGTLNLRYSYWAASWPSTAGGTPSVIPLKTIIEAPQNVVGIRIGSGGLGELRDIGVTTASVPTIVASGISSNGTVLCTRVGVQGYRFANCSGIISQGTTASVSLTDCATSNCGTGITCSAMGSVLIRGNAAATHNGNYGVWSNGGSYTHASGITSVGGNQIADIAVGSGGSGLIFGAGSVILGFSASGMQVSEMSRLIIQAPVVATSANQIANDAEASYFGLIRGQPQIAGDRKLSPAIGVLSATAGLIA